MPVVGNRVRTLRGQLRYRQSDLAEWLGINRSYLSEIENDRADNVGSEIVTGLAKGLSTTTDYLLGLSNTSVPTESDLQITELEWRCLELFRLLPGWLQNMMIQQVKTLVDHDDDLRNERDTTSDSNP